MLGPIEAPLARAIPDSSSLVGHERHWRKGLPEAQSSGSYKLEQIGRARRIAKVDAAPSRDAYRVGSTITSAGTAGNEQNENIRERFVRQGLPGQEYGEQSTAWGSVCQ
jgi:hypothetical protein